jgi:trimethylamine--corrinoid protein Co-methyltransferase
MTQPLNTLPVYDLVDDEALDLIHEKSLQILSEIGIAFYDDESQSILKEHGAEVDDEGVARFEPGLVEAYLAKAPGQFTQLARNPTNNMVFGGKYMCFSPVYGPPYVVDRENGRREANLADFQNFVRLAYMSPYIHHSGGTIVEPTDLPVETRHLDMIYSHIKYSDKAFMGSVTSAENAADSVAMAELLFGADEIRENPALISLINISSPRRLDDRMLGALKPSTPGCNHHTFCIIWGYGACIYCRDSCASKRRSVGWDCFRPNVPTRNTCYLRFIPDYH